MNRNILHIVLLFLVSLGVVFPGEANAQRKSDFRDSLDFMADDGEMTPDEMEAEAIGVHNRCAADLSKKTYFDCSCIGGAFLKAREEQGPYVMQFEILKQIYNENPQCINDPAIAGEMFKNCTLQSEIFRRGEENNIEYCECAAREAVRLYKLRPSLRYRAIESVLANAYVNCAQEFPTEETRIRLNGRRGG